jgi:PadR family transcriptional regulator PadR
MGKEQSPPSLLQGTLDLLILRAVLRKPLHGYAIAEAIHRVSRDVLTVEEGSLYPALHRLELVNAIEAEWGVSENNRRAKYYRITPAGRKQLGEQRTSWDRLSTAINQVLKHA